MSVSLSMNQDYHVNGRSMTVQISPHAPDLGKGVIWIQTENGGNDWRRFRIKQVRWTATIWKLCDHSVDHDTTGPLAYLVEQWLVENTYNLCNGKS